MVRETRAVVRLINSALPQDWQIQFNSAPVSEPTKAVGHGVRATRDPSRVGAARAHSSPRDGSAAPPVGGFPDQVAQGAHAARPSAERRSTRPVGQRRRPNSRGSGDSGRPGRRASISIGSQARYGPDAIRARPARAGPDDGRDAPPGARVQAIEEFVQRRGLRLRAQIGNTVDPRPVGQ